MHKIYTYDDHKPTFEFNVSLNMVYFSGICSLVDYYFFFWYPKVECLPNISSLTFYVEKGGTLLNIVAIRNIHYYWQEK